MTTATPKMSLSLFHPKYWATWIGLGIIYLIVQLPLPWIWSIGKQLGRAVAPLMKKRIHIARTNIQLCFPSLTEQQQEKIIKENLEAQGIGLLEMGMGWWWSDKRIQSVYTLESDERVRQILEQGRGVLAITPHNINLEIHGRLFGVEHQAMHFYRQHNNALLEYMQYHGRMRSSAKLINKRSIKTLMSALRKPNMVIYLPDQDYGPDRAEFVPFYEFATAATTTATHNIIKRTSCAVIMTVLVRSHDGYIVKVLPGPENYPSDDDQADCHAMNKAIESMIDFNPAQYLWAHRRFKTRPPEAPKSVY